MRGRKIICLSVALQVLHNLENCSKLLLKENARDVVLMPFWN